jgi:methenyltetrahydromethanopterin cyclohydrolase
MLFVYPMAVEGSSSSMSKISLNASSLTLVKRLCKEAEKYAVAVEETVSGATLVDAGINAEGGFLAGEIVTEICLGGYGTAKLLPIQYGDVILPSMFVQTDHPTLSTLASQFAGWQIKIDEFSAIASGPARALALKPKDLFEKINYKEESDTAVLVLETETRPSETVIQQIAAKCRVTPNNLYLLLFSTTSPTGATQVAGRIVETGLFKLMRLGFDPWLAKHAWGYAPVVPLHPSSEEAMGRSNDAVLYGGTANYTVNYEDDGKLATLVMMAPSSASKMLQEAKRLADKSPRFIDIFKDVGFDFYKIDPNIFAPAVVVVNNLKTGKSFQAGHLDIEVVKASLGIP